MKTNRLFYTVNKRYEEDGKEFKIAVNILLDDKCKNGVCNWSVTGDIHT